MLVSESVLSSKAKTELKHGFSEFLRTLFAAIAQLDQTELSVWGAKK